MDNIYTKFILDGDDQDIVSNYKETISDYVWPNGDTIGKTSISGTAKTLSKRFEEVYDTDGNIRLFTISYGNYENTRAISGEHNTKANYLSLVNLLLSSGTFFGTDDTEAGTKGIVILSIDKKLVKDSINIDSFRINVDGTTAYTITIDENSLQKTSAGDVYNLVENIGNRIIGKIYISQGIIVLNGKLLNTLGTINLTSASSGVSVCDDIYEAILNTTDFSWILNSLQELNSTFYTCKIGSSKYNFTNNPSFLNKVLNDGTILESMFDNPNVYVTTIGLYNDNNELLAVAKLNKPIKKNFTLSAAFQVRIDI